MGISHAQPGEVVNLALTADGAGATTQALVKTDAVELIRLVVPAGKEIATHQARGQVVVQCLKGRVAIILGPTSRELSAGELLWLEAGQRHAVKGIEDGVLLLTLLLIAKETEPDFDRVEEASEESFPASDPPSFTPLVRP